MSLLLLFLYLYSVNSSLFIQSSVEYIDSFISSGKYLKCDTVPFISPHIKGNITAPVITTSGCKPINVTNSIVITSWETSCKFSEKILNLQKGGALAIIFEHNILPGAYARSNEMPKNRITIPVLSVQNACIKSLLNKDNITGIIEESPNGWLPIYDHPLYYIGQCIIGIIACIIIVLSILGSVYNYYEMNRVITTKTVVLIFEIFLNLFVLLSAIDLAAARGIYGQYLNTLFILTTGCFMAMSNLLMGFYFLELFKDQLTGADAFLNVYKLPFLVFTFFVIVITFILGLLANDYLISISTSGLILGVFLFISNLFALGVLIAVLVKCYSLKMIEGYFKQIRTVILNFVVICVILTVIIIVLKIVYGVDAFYRTYHLRIISNFALIFHNALSSFKIYKLVVVQTMKKKFSSKGSATSKKKTTSDLLSKEESTDKKEKGEKKAENDNELNDMVAN